MNAPTPSSNLSGAHSDVGASANGGIVPCWSCRGPVAEGMLFCDTCKAVQPPGQVDHFRRLGVDIGFDLDRARLDRQFFDLQRQLHPDRFATKSAREKSLSQSQSVSLNQAYEILKDDLLRADYLVHLKGTGGPDAPLPEGCNLVNDPVILMESMEQREALAAAETVADVTTIETRSGENIKTCIAQLSELFAADDVEGACRLTTRLKYLRKLATEIRHRKMKLATGS